MTRFRAVSSSLLIAALAAVASAQQSPEGDDPMAPDAPPGRPELVVGTGTPVTIDGTAAEGEWDDVRYVDIGQGQEIWARAAMKRAGRDLVVHVASPTSAWAFGLKLAFSNPRTGERCTALVTPLNPPRPPLSLYREKPDEPVEWVRAGACDLRMNFREEGGFEFEVRLPLDRIGIGRDDQRYAFQAGVWDLQADRALAVYPMATSGPLVGRETARLLPESDWGMDVPLTEEVPPPQPALALLEDIAAEDRGQAYDGGPPPEVIQAFLGTEDGRRRDAPLARMEERLRALIEAYPEYVSLRANLVRVLAGRNERDAAVEQLEAIEKEFPVLGDDIPQVSAKVQLLVGAGRYDEALAVLDFLPDFLEHVPGAREMRASIETLKYHAALEERMRAQDEARGDLPRVRVETGKGSFVLELYEDDAPNAVANFVSLCEEGFYDGTRFHWVERGGRVVGGDPLSRNDDPDDDGYGTPGYLIESEVGRRLHEPGTIAFVDQRRRPRSEGCVFTVHLSPLPQLDGRNTVFGRVVEGMAVVNALEYGDAIVGTEVLRKRDHAYRPIRRPARDG